MKKDFAEASTPIKTEQGKSWFLSYVFQEFQNDLFCIIGLLPVRSRTWKMGFRVAHELSLPFEQQSINCWLVHYLGRIYILELG